MFDTHNELYEDEVRAFGPALVAPANSFHFPHAKWVHIADFRSGDESDGQDVEVDVEMWPAHFFRIRVLDTANSVGHINKGFTLDTGSGQAELVVTLAKAISTGMLALTTED